MKITLTKPRRSTWGKPLPKPQYRPQLCVISMGAKDVGRLLTLLNRARDCKVEAPRDLYTFQRKLYKGLKRALSL